jgi:hypothetical protein
MIDHPVLRCRSLPYQLTFVSGYSWAGPRAESRWCRRGSRCTPHHPPATLLVSTLSTFYWATVRNIMDKGSKKLLFSNFRWYVWYWTFKCLLHESIPTWTALWWQEEMDLDLAKMRRPPGSGARGWSFAFELTRLDSLQTQFLKDGIPIWILLLTGIQLMWHICHRAGDKLPRPP